MNFGPKEINIKDIGTNSLGAFISGIIGSIIILILIFSLSSFINVSDSFVSTKNGIGEKNSIFPLILSIITFLATSSTMFITYLFLHFTNPEKYKKNNIILGQIAFFTFFVYLFMAPAYIYSGLLNYDYIMIVFLFHTILIVFGINLIIELLNNYRYVLVSIYGSFLGLFSSILITILIYGSFDSDNAKLISLLFLLPLINFMQVFFKGLFNFGYYYYNKITNLDQIGDIFYQIEIEEKQDLREEEEKNTI